MGDKVLRIYPQLHRMLYTPQSMFDYAMVLVRPLVHARQLDALGIEVSVDIVRIRRGVLTVGFREPRIYIPAGEVGIDEEVYGRYRPVIMNILTTLSSDLKRVHDIFNKAMDTGVSETELNSLGYFFGDLQGEVASFLRRIDKTKPAQWEGLVGKYLTILLATSISGVSWGLTSGWVGGVVTPHCQGLRQSPFQSHLASQAPNLH